MITFKELMATPGPDGETDDQAYLRYRAQKRRRGVLGGTIGGPVGESVEQTDELELNEVKKDHFVYQKDAKKTKEVVHRGTEQSSKEWIEKNAKHYSHKGRGFDIYKGTYPNVKPSDKIKYSYVAEEVELDEALNMQQRLQRSRSMKRNKSKVKLGRERALRKTADMGSIKRRAQKHARLQIFKKLSKGKSPSELPFAKRQEIEKRLSKMAPRIERIAKKLIPQVRKIEQQRRQSRNASTQSGTK